MSEYGDRLFPHHQEELRASAIDPVVARERGYVSVDTKAEMERRGFGSSQRNVPALLLPLHRVDGEVAGYQAKPDEPRAGSDGRPIKYETPSKQKLVVDVHPRIRDEVRSGHGPLFITEGVKKADAAISAGLTCVALLGVFSWRGRTDDEALTALADWELINLRDRQVYICFDSDIALKPQVREAMVRLKAFLQMRGAEVAVIYLPSGPAGVKVGLDDFLASGRTVDEMLSRASVEVRTAQAPKPDEYADVPEESGAQLLDDVAGFIRRYLALPSDAELVALVLWVVHTWVIDAFDTTPRLNVTSPEKGSGKTRVLEVLEKLCRNAAMTVNMSVAFLFRLLDAEENLPTLLFDEVDTIFAPGKHEDLRGVLNAGYRRGPSVGRVVGEGTEMTAKQFQVFAPVAMAGIGALPDTLADRSVPIKLMRRRPDQQVEQFRERAVRKAADPLVRRLGAWASRNLDALRDAEPDLPEGIVDRPADVWEPLIAVADQAGGQWPQLARVAAVKLNETRRTDDASPGVKLLADIRLVFVERDVDRISTEDLRIRLAQMDESDWVDFRGDPLTPRALAKLLDPFGIKPTTMRFGTSSALRGYRDSQFAEAWASYLLPTPLPEAQQVQHAQHRRSEGVEMLRMGGHVADTEVHHAPDFSAEPAPLPSDVADVEDRNGTRNGRLYALTRDVADVADVAGISEGEDTLRVGDREVIEL